MGTWSFVPVPNTLLNAISFPTSRRDIELDSHHNYARAVAKAIAKIPHSDVSDLIILFSVSLIIVI